MPPERNSKSKSLHNQDFTEQVFDLSYVMAENDCSPEEIERAIDIVFDLFLGNRQSAVVKCRSGVRIKLRKKPFGLEITVL